MTHIGYLKRSTLLTPLLFAFLSPAQANDGSAANDINPNELLSLSLEQLTNVEVTSVSKKSEKAIEAAAAIFVISQEDIRRSGATSVPELLRMAPGVNVAQGSSHDWAVSVRGFNSQFANKLLVLIDGRTIYTPLFSGVWWDVQDVMLGDIERIEVIRGPGATLWGANAVNGVINIITKKASDTQGTYLQALAGNQERLITSARYGGKTENAYYRSYAKYSNHDETRTLSNLGAGDEWHNTQAGFRADITPTQDDSITVQGDAYSLRENTSFTFPTLTPFPSTRIHDHAMASGGNVLMRWNRTFSKDSATTLQMYVDNTHRSRAYYRDEINTLDLDFQHTWKPAERHEVVWGAGYRLTANDLTATPYYFLTPESRNDNLFNAFVQDKYALIQDSVFLTLGSKFEHNDYTGFEYQPSARLSWLVDDRQTLWTSVARAVRTPNRSMDDATFVVGTTTTGLGPTLVLNQGDRAAKSERLIAYEAGYRIQPTNKTNFDLAVFYNDYDNLITNRTGTLALRTINGESVPTIPLYPTNGGKGTSWGGELSASWKVTDQWELATAYSLLKTNLSGGNATFVTGAGKSPQQQYNLRSTWLMARNWELDNALYYTDQLPGLRIGDYLRFDSRIAWKPVDGMELSLVGQNLLDNQHPEFSGFVYQSATQVGRSVYGNVTLRF